MNFWTSLTNRINKHVEKAMDTLQFAGRNAHITRAEVATAIVANLASAARNHGSVPTRNMIRALTITSLMNTMEDECRRQAALLVRNLTSALRDEIIDTTRRKVIVKTKPLLTFTAKRG